MALSFDLDHLAVACERQADAWPRYAGDLGGSWLGAGPGYGFSFAQVRYRNGMKVEVLEPFQPEVNDFLRRFLDRRGAGPHHMTFKTNDIHAALERIEACGYRPTGVDLRDPGWKEAFIHPKDAPGVVVQVAQANGDDEWGDPPAGFPSARTAAPAALLHVAHAVADMDDGLRLFRDLLGGEIAAEGGDDDARWIDLRWTGSGVVRLLAAAHPSSALTTWVGGEAGRVHHVAFATSDPVAVCGAKPVDGGQFEIAPEDNLGVRLRLEPDGYAGAHGREIR